MVAPVMRTLAAQNRPGGAQDQRERSSTPGVVSLGTDQPPGRQTLILDDFPTLEQQDLLGPNNGSRRWAVAEERKRVQATTGVEVKRQGIRPLGPPVNVVYTFVVPDRARRDWDNYALICKPVQDGLVKSGVLVGDHYAVLTAQVAFRVERGARRLEITLEQAPEPPRWG